MQSIKIYSTVKRKSVRVIVKSISVCSTEKKKEKGRVNVSEKKIQ